MHHSNVQNKSLITQLIYSTGYIQSTWWHLFPAFIKPLPCYNFFVLYRSLPICQEIVAMLESCPLHALVRGRTKHKYKFILYFSAKGEAAHQDFNVHVLQ